MLSVSLHEAKTHLSSLLATIAQTGETVIINRHGRAVAELTPVARKSRLKISPALKAVKIISDPTETTAGEWEHV